MDKLEAAEKHLELAISAFKEDGGKTDTHYSAALAGLGEVCYRQGSLERALENYEHALFRGGKAFRQKRRLRSALRQLRGDLQRAWTERKS